MTVRLTTKGLLPFLVFGLCQLCASGCAERAKERPSPGAHSISRGMLVIAYAEDSADTFLTSIPESLSVLDCLQRETRMRRIPLATKPYPFGTLVQGIGPRRNGEGGDWLYTVNGLGVPEAADHHRVAPSDTIRFFFRRR